MNLKAALNTEPNRKKADFVGAELFHLAASTVRVVLHRSATQSAITRLAAEEA